MSCETVSLDNSSQAAPSREATTTTNAIESVVAVVRRDCQRDAEKYLEETTVPHGGE